MFLVNHFIVQIKQQVNLSQTEQIHLHEPCRTQTEINPKTFTNFFFLFKCPNVLPYFLYFYLCLCWCRFPLLSRLSVGIVDTPFPPLHPPPPHPSERWLMNPMPQLALLVSLELFFLMFSRLELASSSPTS